MGAAEVVRSVQARMTVRDLPATGAEPQGPSADCVLNSEKYSAASARQRLARAAADNFQFLWRSLRRLGIRPDAAVDDAVQRVFEIAARKVDRVEAGLERAFLFRTAMFVAAEERRGQRRVRDRATEIDPLELAAPEPDPEQALTQRRTREYLDRVLAALPMELRTVFILFELEGLTAVQIGALLDVPEGTASSRLRRARQLFHEEARRLRARIEFRGGER